MLRCRVPCWMWRLSGPRRARGQRGAGHARQGASCGGRHEQAHPAGTGQRPLARERVTSRRVENASRARKRLRLVRQPQPQRNPWWSRVSSLGSGIRPQRPERPGQAGAVACRGRVPGRSQAGAWRCGRRGRPGARCPAVARGGTRTVQVLCWVWSRGAGGHVVPAAAGGKGDASMSASMRRFPRSMAVAWASRAGAAPVGSWSASSCARIKAVLARSSACAASRT